MRWPAPLMCVLCACGRIGFDARSTDAPAVDMEVDGPPGPFGAPMQLAVLASTAEESDPTVTADGLEIYFTSQRNGTRDIFRSTRMTTSDPWGAPVLVTELSSATSEDDTARIRPDGLLMYFGSDRTGGTGGYDIYVTTRASRGGMWSTPALVTELSTTALDLSASLSSTRLEIFWHSDRAGGVVGRELFHAKRPDEGVAFAMMSIAALGSVNSMQNDRSPAVTGSDLTLWFDSDRAGGAGLRDLYTSQRVTTSSPFASPVPVTELNSPADDLDPWVSEDGRWIVFASGRGGNQDLYEAFR